MNVKLLRKIKRHILEEPKRLVMSSYFSQRTKEGVRTTSALPVDEKQVYGRPWPKCNTAACISGWACFLSSSVDAKSPLNVDWFNEGARLLGLTSAQAFRLFEPGDWPEQFMDGCVNDGKPKTAKIAAARIEHFIKTEGRE